MIIAHATMIMEKITTMMMPHGILALYWDQHNIFAINIILTKDHEDKKQVKIVMKLSKFGKHHPMPIKEMF